MKIQEQKIRNWPKARKLLKSHFASSLPEPFYTYFAWVPHLNMIKIGKSKSLKNRIKHLEQACPLPLVVTLVVKAGRSREKKIHESLKAFHSHGEWFYYTGDLRKLVASEVRDREERMKKGEMVCDCGVCTSCLFGPKPAFNYAKAEKLRKRSNQVRRHM